MSRFPQHPQKKFPLWPVPEETIEDWRTLMRLLYKTDHALDSIASPDEKNEKIKVFKDALHGTPKGKDVFVEETLEEIDTLTKNFSEEEKRFFLRKKKNLLLCIYMICFN